jgi:hypothetical protein
MKDYVCALDKIDLARIKREDLDKEILRAAIICELDAISPCPRHRLQEPPDYCFPLSMRIESAEIIDNY